MLCTLLLRNIPIPLGKHKRTSSTQIETTCREAATQTDQRPLVSTPLPSSSALPPTFQPACSSHSCELPPQHHSMVRPQPTIQPQQWPPPLQLPQLMSTPASFLSTEPCRQGTKSGYSMPRDASFRVGPHNHGNAYSHHHRDNSDDDNKRCHNNHQDGDDRILSEQEWPFIQLPDTTKNGLGVAWMRRELKKAHC